MGKRMQVIGCERKLSGSIAFSQEFQASLDEWFDFMRVSSDDIRDFVIALLDRLQIINSMTYLELSYN